MSKEVEHFWKYHNKSNMDIHAVKLIESLEAKNTNLRERVEESEVRHPTDLEGNPNRKVNYCFSCGTNVKTQKYCHGCGRKLIWPKKALKGD